MLCDSGDDVRRLVALEREWVVPTHSLPPASATITYQFRQSRCLKCGPGLCWTGVRGLEAVQRVLLIAKETGCRVHIAHNSCPEAVDAILRGRAEGVDASVESCPHYFLLATEQLDAIGPRAKCSPPIRDLANQARMWDYLAAGKIDIIGSDHSPCTFDLKDKANAFEAWGGLSACQNSVDAMFDAAVKERGLSPALLARVLATNPAERFGLQSKGEIAVGKDADLVFIDTSQSYTVRAEELYYKNKHSAYEGRAIGCRVTRTLLRGHTIFELGKGVDPVVHGRLIRVTGKVQA